LKPQPQNWPAEPDLDELPSVQPGLFGRTIDLMSDLAAQIPGTTSDDTPAKALPPESGASGLGRQSSVK